MDHQAWIEIVKALGVPAALVIFFLIRLREQDKQAKAREDRRDAETKEREERMARALDEIRTQYTEALRTVVVDNTKAVNGVTEAVEKISDRQEALEETVARLGERISDRNIFVEKKT